MHKNGNYLNAGSAAAGRKVFYRNTGSEVGTDGKTLGDHSGIVKSVGSTIMVTSKWGEYGLYEHTIYDCPYAGNRTTYSYWSLA